MDHFSVVLIREEKERRRREREREKERKRERERERKREKEREREKERKKERKRERERQRDCVLLCTSYVVLMVGLYEMWLARRSSLMVSAGMDFEKPRPLH